MVRRGDGRDLGSGEKGGWKSGLSCEEEGEWRKGQALSEGGCLDKTDDF